MRTKKTTWTPNDPVPPYADRNTTAAIISHHLFPVSPRTIATWPLTISRPNRSAIYEVKEALDYAKRKLREAVWYKQGGGSMNILQNKIAPYPREIERAYLGKDMIHTERPMIPMAMLLLF